MTGSGGRGLYQESFGKVLVFVSLSPASVFVFLWFDLALATGMVPRRPVSITRSRVRLLMSWL